MNAEIINIGDELLIGQTVNTNAAWMGEKLATIGVAVKRTVVIPDEREDIISALDSALSRVDLIILSGGLGPTNDDITKSVLAEYFNSPMEMNQEVLDRVSSYFAKWNRPMLESNTLQAMLPTKAEVLQNNMGTASGMWFDENNKVVISVPGVPFEVKHLMTEMILPKIKTRFKTQAVYHRTVLTCGMGESFLADKLEDWEKSLSVENIKLAYLPSSDGRLKLRLSSEGETIEPLKTKTKIKVEELKLIIPELIYGYDNDRMEDIVGKLLLKNNKRIATAESCSGGYIAHLLTSIAGSSEYYQGSAITYSYQSKSHLLKVPHEMILEKGVVSEEVVRQMALGIFDVFDVDYSIAVSGIAGPGGGIVGKPVGTVWMAVGTKDKMVTKKFKFGNHREYNIKRTGIMALNILRQQLMEI
ncbi:MAG: nicotinamide-nucleotide amidase [Patiriisocius sp.]|jgi:nicotinamide-nucleotide amidase